LEKSQKNYKYAKMGGRSKNVKNRKFGNTDSLVNMVNRHEKERKKQKATANRYTEKKQFRAPEANANRKGDCNTTVIKSSQFERGN